MTPAPPLRVLFVDEGVLGHRTMTAQLREALAAHPEVAPIFATVPPPNRLERLLLRRWRPLGDWDMFELRWRLRWSWRARRLLKRHLASVDVALVTTVASALLMHGPMRRLPCVLSTDATVAQFRALEYALPNRRRSGLQERLLTRLERRAIGRAAAVVAWTGWTAAALRRESDSPELRIETIHPGLDADWWAEAAARRGARGDAPMRVLFVGNDVERKGLATLVAAIDGLDGDAVVDVVSTDPVPESEAVDLHRGVAASSERLRDLYATADVLALPTRADAAPWVVLEAMAAGLPVAASNVGAIAELVDGAGELVEPGDADALTAALRRLADPERRNRLAALGLRLVRERYDAAVQVPRLLELLREVAGRPGGGAGRGRVRRRTFVAVGLGAAGVAVAAPYVVLLPDDEFEQLVASHLGIEPKLAGQLLQRAREDYGGARYDAHAAAFALAVRGPVATVLPGEARERAIRGLVEPMLSAPASNLAYGITGSDPGGAAPCAGLVRTE